ncbi:hypothetical protein CALVIDRAFT_325645 [Calocera viscosa TUFC12733]|uniref:Uncharacterized protein n=1 Tax=Calocera viscosa (strain TUFC12733) TaxID=1330018 RepID=A0A167QTX3_CALVF|nr:hypothetical protein CALVIDRAFT_325645 [Calocera viscosa TUFC12733]
MLIALSQPPDDDQDASHPRLLRIISPVDETESANAAHLAPTPFHTINDDDILGPLLVPSFIMNLEVAEKVAVSSIRNGNGSAGGDESSSKLDVQPPIPSAEGQYPAGNKALHNIPPVPDTTGHISQKRPYEDPPRLLGPSLQPSSHTLPPRPLSYTYDRPDPPSLSSQWPDIDEVDMTPPTKRQRTEPGSPQRRVVDIRPRRRPRDSWVSSHYERSRRDRDMDYERSRRDMDYDREREFGRRWDEPVQTGGTVFRGRGTRHAPLP